MKFEYIECECNSPNHMFRVISEDPFTDEDNMYSWDPEMHIEFQLYQHRNFFQRCWSALKYIFGCKQHYGMWDTVELDKTAVIKLKNLCYLHLNKIKQWEKQYER